MRVEKRAIVGNLVMLQISKVKWLVFQNILNAVIEPTKLDFVV